MVTFPFDPDGENLDYYEPSSLSPSGSKHEFRFGRLRLGQPTPLKSILKKYSVRFGHSQYKEIEKTDSLSMDNDEVGDAPSLPVTQPISVDVSDGEEEEEEDEEDKEEEEEEEMVADSDEDSSGDEGSPNQRRIRNRKWLLENKQSQSREHLAAGDLKQTEDENVDKAASTGRVSRRRESTPESVLDRAMQMRARRESGSYDVDKGYQSGPEDTPLRLSRRTRRNSAPADPSILPLEEQFAQATTAKSQGSGEGVGMKRVNIYLIAYIRSEFNETRFLLSAF